MMDGLYIHAVVVVLGSRLGEKGWLGSYNAYFEPKKSKKEEHFQIGQKWSLKVVNADDVTLVSESHSHS